MAWPQSLILQSRQPSGTTDAPFLTNHVVGLIPNKEVQVMIYFEETSSACLNDIARTDVL